MSADAGTTPVTAPIPGRPTGQSIGSRVLRIVRRQPLGTVGLVIFVLLILTAVFAPVIATHDPLALDTNRRFDAPSGDHWFGTDSLGRDLYSRIIYGARTSLIIGVSSVSLGATLGAVIGIVSAYYARLDLIAQRFIDALLAVPALLLALAIVAVLGASLTNTVLAIAVASVPSAARVLRSQALSIKERPYVEAARASGASDLRILVRHITPNCGAPFIILASVGLATAILAEASLSFLGLGTPPPRPSWGRMLSGSVQQYASVAPWLAIFPGLAITIVVLGFNLFGDALRDVLDPRLRGSR
jgi:peptide/nickel transport system permease protein